MVAIGIGESLVVGGGFGGDVVFGPGEISVGIGIDIPILEIVLTSESGYETSQELVLPAGAVVTRAAFTVSGKAPPFAVHVGDIGSVRAAAGAPTSSSDQLVVDFGVLRTVSSVNAPAEVTSVTAWRGTRFDQYVTEGSGSGYVEFTEVQTERLLIGLVSSVSPATFAGQATVTTTTPPADLELMVGDTRAWNRAGPTPEGFSEDVDVTPQVQALLDGAAPDADGNVHVPVTLRARVPGQLELSLAQPVGYLRTHTVAFPGATTALSFAEEGRVDLELPLPDDADDWLLHRVLVTATATDEGPNRVLPPVGPAPSELATLVLDPDKRIVVHVPAVRFARFERLVGVRVAVQPQAGGVELTGALLADAERANAGDPPVPGDPVPKGTFTPVTLDAADAPAFVTLELPQPLKLVPGAALWFSLAATRGSAAVGLAATGDASSATLRRVMPNGVVRELSSPVGVRTDVLQLRIVGLPPDAAPVDVVDVELSGGATVEEPITDPELAAGGLVSLALATPEARPGLALQLTATAATTVTVGPVVIAYVDPSEGGSP